MEVSLTLIHWIYLVFIVAIIGFMLFRRDTTIVCIVGILSLAAVSTLSISDSVSSLFNSFIFAITELLPTILVISIIVAMSKILTISGINEVMISPFAKVIKNPTTAFWTVGILTVFRKKSPSSRNEVSRDGMNFG